MARHFPPGRSLFFVPVPWVVVPEHGRYGGGLFPLPHQGGAPFPLFCVAGLRAFRRVKAIAPIWPHAALPRPPPAPLRKLHSRVYVVLFLGEALFY